MRTSMNWDTKEFERAMDDVSNESDRSDFEIITMNAKTLVKAAVYNTPRDTGTTRAGYWPAWEALGMSGSPGTRRRYRAWKSDSGRRYVPKGGVDDQRKNKRGAYFEFINKSHYRKGDAKVYYPYILNAKTNFMGEAEEEATFKFGRVYEKMLRKHGKL